MPYPLSTICLIIYFVLAALASFGVYLAPTVVFGVVEALVAIFLLIRT